MKRLIACSAMALVLSLSACGEDVAEVPSGDSDAGVQGELLGGTTSDAMLPLDQVRSQSPQIEPAPDRGGSTGASTPAEDTASDASEPTPESEPAPAENPAEEG